MELSKSTMQGIGALALVAVLAGAGFFVVKPQVTQALDLQSKTEEVQQISQARELRLIKLTKASKDITTLKKLVDGQLKLIPARRDTDDIEKTVVEALEHAGLPDTALQSYKYSALDPAQPSFKAPTLTLTPPAAPFELKDPADELKPADGAAGSAASGASSSGDSSAAAGSTDTPTAEATPAPATDGAAATDSTAGKSNLQNTFGAVANGALEQSTDEGPNSYAPAMAGAPFTIDVSISDTEQLMKFIDQLQNESRLITVASVTTSNGTATIYAYAYAGSDALVQKWEATDEK